MRAALLVAMKDLRIRMRDRSVLLTGIVAPFGLAFIFNLILGGAGTGGAIQLGVVDDDHGVIATTFTQEVLGPAAKEGIIAVHSEPSDSEARSRVKSGKLDAAVLITPGFSDAVQSGQAASMEVIGNPGAPVSAEVTRAIAQGYVDRLNQIRVSVETVAAGATRPLSPADFAALASAAAAAEAPIAISDVTSGNKQLDSKSYYAAGMAVFFLFFTVEFGVLGLLEERSSGTLNRLMAAPIRRASILGGKLITSFVLGVVAMSVLAVSTSLLFGAKWGNPIGVAVLMVTAVLAATGVASLVMTIARTPDEAQGLQAVVSLVLGLLGGTFFPVSQAQGIIANLTFVAPQAWFMRGLGDLRAGDLSGIWTPALVLLGFALVSGGLAWLRLRRAGDFA